MKKNIFMTLSFLILLTTSWASHAMNWVNPRSIAQEFVDDANYSSPRHFVRKWRGHHFTFCDYYGCSEQVGKGEQISNQRQWISEHPGSECTIAYAWWEGDRRLVYSCTNGFSSLLIFNQNYKVVRQEVRS